MSDPTAVITSTAAVHLMLGSAHSYGIPMPYNVSVTAYDNQLLVHTVEEWDAWLGYLDPGARTETAGDDTQLVLNGTAYECDVEVRVVLPEGEPSAHLAEMAEEHLEDDLASISQEQR